MTGASPLPVYVGAFVLTAGPGALMIASRLHQRVAWIHARSLPSCYTVVTGIIAIPGCLLWPTLMAPPPVGWPLLAALPATAALSWAAIRADTTVARRMGRAQRGPGTATHRRVPTAGQIRVRPAGIARGSGPTRRAVPHDPESYRRRRTAAAWATPGWLLAVALAEELLYRGALLGFATTLPPVAEWAAILLSLLTFAAVHIGFGWIQVGAKLSLSVITTAAVLLLGSVVAGIVIHGLFNLHYWRRRSTLAVSAAGTVWTS